MQSRSVDSRVSQERPDSGARGVTPSLRAVWVGLVRRGPSIVRRLRLASGLVLFSYVFLHFLNHSLGNISLEAMERGASSRNGSGAAQSAPSRSTVHSRSTSRWRSGRSISAGICGWAGSRLCASCSACSIPALIVSHAVQQRLSYTLFDAHRVYRNAPLQLLVRQPADRRRPPDNRVHGRLAAWLHRPAFVAAGQNPLPQGGAVSARAGRPRADDGAARGVPGRPAGRREGAARSGLAGGVPAGRTGRRSGGATTPWNQ